jgi:hypothetical protein
MGMEVSNIGRALKRDLEKGGQAEVEEVGGALVEPAIAKRSGGATVPSAPFGKHGEMKIKVGQSQ